MPATHASTPAAPLPGITITGNRTGWTARERGTKRTIAKHASLGGLLAKLTRQATTHAERV